MNGDTAAAQANPRQAITARCTIPLDFGGELPDWVQVFPEGVHPITASCAGASRARRSRKGGVA